MLRIFSLFVIILIPHVFITPHPAEAVQTIVAVQSVRAKPFDEAFNGFRAALGSGASVKRLVIADLKQRGVAEVIRSASPDLVYAIGIDALANVSALTDIPVVYAMVLEADLSFPHCKQVTGVMLEIDPEKQLEILLDILPRTRKIGLLYDPEQTGGMVDRIRAAAKNKAIRLIERQICRPKNVPLSVIEMKDQIDVFWMMPDLTVITPETVEFLILYTMESKIPILTFSEKYVEQGALLSIGVEPFDMGRQAAEMAVKIMSGADAASLPDEKAEKAVVSVNPKVAKKLGIFVDENVNRHVGIRQIGVR